MFPQPVLVAFDNGEGVVYAPASGWDKLYLLWTFRNFRSLPQSVLNPRQQQLMASLYRNTSHPASREIFDAPVVGTIEDFDPSKFVNFTISREDSTPAASPPQERSADVAVLDHDQRFRAPLVLGRMTMKIGAGTLAALIAILAWHQLGAASFTRSAVADTQAPPASAHLESTVVAPDLTTAASAAEEQPSIASGAPIAITSTTPLAARPSQPVAAEEVPAQPAANISGITTRTEPVETAAKAPVTNERAVHAHLPTAVPLVLRDAVSDQPRVQISGRPRKLVYPVCPETKARGKVSLQAVVEYDGAVSRVRVLTGDRTLAKAAVEAVRQWRYEPFPGADLHVERETNITVSFISNEVIAVSFPECAPRSR